MSHYLIEFRFFGKAKHEIRKIVWDLHTNFGVRSRSIPHITLAGPFSTKDEGRLVEDFYSLCLSAKTMHFKVDGYSTFEDNGVVYINIKPDKELEEFRYELSKTLKKYCDLKRWDYEKDFKFHATLAMKLYKNKLDEIKNYLEKKSKPKFNHVLLRVTIIKNRIILCEYDFMLRKMLNRHEAKSNHMMSESFRLLDNYLKENKITETSVESMLPIKEIDLEKINEGLFDKIMRRNSKIFLISDLHLDHANIIRFCHRPFESIHQMNDTLVKNWNDTVGKNDLVLFGGDVSYGKCSKSTRYWIEHLNGRKIIVKGNHDKSRRLELHEKLILKYKKRKFMFLHNPEDVPSTWKDWVIHGHVHNNKPEYTLIDKKNKRINISAEMLNYKPISLERVLEMIE